MISKKTAVTVIFNSINVNAISDVSGIFVGDNMQWNWSLNNKCNYGFGEIIGKNNLIYKTLNYVFDPDVVDAPVNETLIGSQYPNVVNQYKGD